jgi:sensor histidine kinase YesM
MLNIIKDYLLQIAFIVVFIFVYELFFAERSARNKNSKVMMVILLGLSIVFCMSSPSPHRMDIRGIPLLLGTLYGGVRTGIILSIIIIVYRLHIGVDVGLYNSTVTLLISMPIILYLQKFFIQANKKKKLQIALLLSLIYNLVGLATYSIIKGIPSFQVFQMQFILIMINVVGVLFFVYLNEMIKEIIRKNQQLQSEAKDAEIAFLRAQINPHFLYNVLNTIAELCIDKPRKAEELTLDFAQYLRSSFDFKLFESMTTIEKELELVESYLNIEKARFGDRLCVEYDVDANPDTQIPPLVLQPLVENAIKHGLLPNLRGGTVKICVKKEAADVISFAVEDNGSGMSEIMREKVLMPHVKTNGIGLWNINQRIKLLYGKSIHIESSEGLGTKVFFEIPARPVRPIGG